MDIKRGMDHAAKIVLEESYQQQFIAQLCCRSFTCSRTSQAKLP